MITAAVIIFFFIDAAYEANTLLLQMFKNVTYGNTIQEKLSSGDP